MTHQRITGSLSRRVLRTTIDCPRTPRPLIIRVPQARSFALALATVVAIGACQSGPQLPTLTDPREILAAAVTTASTAKTVRIDGSADGTVGLDLAGSAAPAAFEVSGTTFSADLDLEDGDARATFSAPGLLGLTGEVIFVDGTAYLKSTLTGALYRKLPIGAEIPEPSDAARANILDALTDLLANPELGPVKAEDIACGGSTCYQVEIALSPADLVALGAADLEPIEVFAVPIPLPAMATATVDLTVLVTKDTNRLAGVTADADLGANGAAVVDLTFSKWDEPVSIGTPPPEQVAPGN